MNEQKKIITNIARRCVGYSNILIKTLFKNNNTKINIYILNNLNIFHALKEGKEKSEASKKFSCCHSHEKY